MQNVCSVFSQFTRRFVEHNPWENQPVFGPHKNDRLIFIFAIFGVFGIALLALIRQAKSKFTSSSESDIE